MRAIKFRAWNKESGGWNHSITGRSESTPFVINQVTTFSIPENDHLNVQQYTGLKDKNGKEIYEGDIVRVIVPTKSEGEWLIGVVTFDLGAFSVKLPSPFQFQSLISIYKRDPKMRDPKYHRTLEVIGNVYENPELVS